MIKIIETKNCCGCAACVLRCPKQCITMHEDEEGFLYPHVDEVSCIDCGLCEKICPVINQDAECIPLHTYAAKNKNEAQRLRSSSGGIFVLLAEHIISEGGVVFGARFDANWEVEHGYAETWDELAPFMRSKYVQSRIGNTYQEAEAFLKAGRKVLFTGTSCQIAGLKKFCAKITTTYWRWMLSAMAYQALVCGDVIWKKSKTRETRLLEKNPFRRFL